MKVKRPFVILFIVLIILLIPLVAMQFTDEVNWSLFDFVIVGALLASTGLVLELGLRMIKNHKTRIIFGLALFIVLILIWLELAVGIFGTPLAGN